MKLLVKARIFLARKLIGSNITFVSNVIVEGDTRLLGFDSYLMNNTFKGRIFGRYGDEYTLSKETGKFVMVSK